MKSFEQIYRDVPQVQRQMLLDFRASHPYREIHMGETTWRYIACGQGGKTILLLPGALMKADLWFQTITTLETKYRIISPDNYALQGTFDMGDVCEAHIRILDREGVDKATVVGISGGAGVAQFLFQDYPDRVEHIVFSHSGVIKPDNTERFQKKVKLIKLLPFAVIRKILGKITRKHWAYPPSSEWIEFRSAYLSEMGTLLNKKMFLPFMVEGSKAHGGFCYDPLVAARFAGKILLLSSEGDDWTRDQQREWMERYPGAESHVFEEGGHHTVLLFPERYNAVLTEFLERAYEQ